MGNWKSKDEYGTLRERSLSGCPFSVPIGEPNVICIAKGKKNSKSWISLDENRKLKPNAKCLWIFHTFGFSWTQTVLESRKDNNKQTFIDWFETGFQWDSSLALNNRRLMAANKAKQLKSNDTFFFSFHGSESLFLGIPKETNQSND